MKLRGKAFPLRVIVTFGFVALSSHLVSAHCDGMDGPVVIAAQNALAKQDVNLVLIWVQKEDEQELRDVFDHTLRIRELSAEARELADRYFFETLVRIHRAGEGAPYTGLKPAGRDLGPAISLTDEALSTGEIDTLIELIVKKTRHGLIERFNHTMEARRYSPSDVEAGREYVRNYVAFVHYAERAYEAAVHPVAGHSEKNHATDDHNK